MYELPPPSPLRAIRGSFVFVQSPSTPDQRRRSFGVRFCSRPEPLWLTCYDKLSSGKLRKDNSRCLHAMLSVLSRDLLLTRVQDRLGKLRKVLPLSVGGKGKVAQKSATHANKRSRDKLVGESPSKKVAAAQRTPKKVILITNYRLGCT